AAGQPPRDRRDDDRRDEDVAAGQGELSRGRGVSRGERGDHRHGRQGDCGEQVDAGRPGAYRAIRTASAVPHKAQVKTPIANEPAVTGPALAWPNPAAAIGTPPSRMASPYSSVTTRATPLATALTSQTGRRRKLAARWGR